jgi:aconitate hydratase
MSQHPDSFGARSTLTVAGTDYEIFRLDALARGGIPGVDRLPYSIKVLLENVLRWEDGVVVRRADVEFVARWQAAAEPSQEISFYPARVLLQDFTGVPAVVDLAAMRAAVARLGKDPTAINPLQPVDLVIDHSVQIDHFGSRNAYDLNVRLEYQRNKERYMFLRWGQKAFENFRVVPPGMGICHQVNLEYLARGVWSRKVGGRLQAYPDTLVGTDSHTTMINGLGVLGWGVGGIEAEAAMLGQPITMLLPQVVGFRLHGQLAPGATATDLVLTATAMLRKHGVVGKLVEFYGPGLAGLSLPDRATLANMAPEYGATCGIFPIDDETISFLRLTGRPAEVVALTEAYAKEQGLFRTEVEPVFSSSLELDLSTVEPSLAGPKRPQDRVPLRSAKATWLAQRAKDVPQGGDATVEVRDGDLRYELGHGAVVIAAITSCTNTSNPDVLVAAGLLARNAVRRGLKVRPWVKTSLAPGSRVVSDYLERAGLLPYLEALGFHVVGYGCTTCIGNSGPLSPAVVEAVEKGKLVVSAVLSGNRNFEGRISPHVRANWLASPPLVVAYALAGRMDVDLLEQPIGRDPTGQEVFLKDVWPSAEEVRAAVREVVTGELYRTRYAAVFDGDEAWRSLAVPEGQLFAWDDDSTYVRHPPYFAELRAEPAAVSDLSGARCLAKLGDSVTTDHISPAGDIASDGPAATYLKDHAVARADFNSFGARRGNHEVMIRGTFANIRLKNELAPGTEGGVTRHQPSGEPASIYDAAMRYQREGVPLVVLAGKEYGTGSSRDWAAKGTALLGVRAVIAKSFERIHRSNLIGMGVLPLEFREGEGADELGLTGAETFAIRGVASGLAPRVELTVEARREDGTTKTFTARCRLDTPNEVDYYRHGGILQYVLRRVTGS